jgi:hypothetical protein
METSGGGSILKEAVTFTRVNFMEQADAIERILQVAVQQTLSIQKKLGNPISIGKNGQVIIVPPEEIVLASELTATDE